jgi:uncharacterized protein YhaN
MFTDVDLNLLPRGVNVIVGANEAGKTIAMAAIQQLLYGIPVRSEHAFIHLMSDLRIGAVLQDEAGTEVAVTRVKRQTGTLRSSSDDPLDEEVLRRLLHGVGEDVYRTLFAIGHDEIASGGQALLKSDGELGRALFGASTGLTRLNKVMAQLDSRADQLFKPSASRPAINAALAKFKGLSQQVKELSKSASAVVKLDDELQQAEKDLKLAAAQFSELSNKKNLATRVRATRPLVYARGRFREELTSLEEQGSRVAPDVPTRLAESQQLRREAQPKVTLASKDVSDLDDELLLLHVDEPLLAQTELVSDLVKEIGALRQNMKDLPSLNKQVGDLERQLDSLRRSLPAGCPVDDHGMPTISGATLATIKRLSKERPVLDTSLQSTRDLLADASLKLRRAAEDLAGAAPSHDVTQLRAAAGRIRQEGRLESARDATLRKATVVEGSITATLVSLGIDVAPAAADRLALPAARHVAEVDAAVREAAAGVDKRNAQLQKLRQQQETTREELHELLRQEAPPSEQELLETRAQRDQGWQLVRSVWLDGDGDTAAISQWTEGKPLETAYEAAVEQADEIADRLRLEAGAVERRSLLERQLEEIEHAFAAESAELERASAEAAAAQQQWVGIWVPLGLEARSRQEMDELLDRIRRAAGDATSLRSLRAEASTQGAGIERHLQDLRTLVAQLGESATEGLSLASVLDLADDVCKRSDRARDQRAGLQHTVESLTENVRDFEAKLASAGDRLSVWSTQWADAVTTLGLARAAEPSDVDAALATIPAIEIAFNAFGEKQRRVSGIERRNAQIQERLTAAIGALPQHADIDVSQPEVAIGILQSRFKAAQDAATTRNALRTRLKKKSEDLDKARRQIEESEIEIAAMVAAEDVADERVLIEAVARTQRCDKLAEQIGGLESQLIETTGLPLERLDSEVDDFEGVDLETEINVLTRQCTDLDTLRNECAVRVGELRKARVDIDASDEAAVAAEHAQEVLADLVTDADEYVRVVLARVLLEEQIADYRERNQGPILGRASQLFHDLTLSRYGGLDTDLDDKGVPMILAKAASGGTVEVARLSTGARDQLYLALRLAALEHFVQQDRHLPLILDDLFVHFDDDRTEAGLRVLQGLSEHVQVLLFTHHERVAAQAQSVLDPSGVKVLRLPNTSAPQAVQATVSATGE